MVSQAIYGDRPKAARHKELAANALPDTQHVLHAQTHARDADPAAKTERNRLAALLDQVDDIGIKAHGSHGHDDEELGERLERRRDGCRQRKYRGDHTREDEKQHEEREDLLERERVARIRTGLLRLMHLPEGEYKRDGDDGEYV